MPEGDTAYRAAHHLGRALAGRTVTRFELRVPRAAAADLAGEQVRGAHSRGKHLLLEIGPYTVHSHLGMDGAWRLERPESPHWPAAHRLRALIDTDRVLALGIDLPLVELWPTRDEDRRLGWLGPDLLAEAPDLDEATRRILAEPDRPITAALLDQRNVAGLGNEYVTELCFLMGVAPSRPVAEAGDIRAWIDLGRELMLANRDRVGRVFTGDPREPNYVFGRVGRPCRRCGSIIVGGTHASGTSRPGAETRDSAWCPNCQPGEAA